MATIRGGKVINMLNFRLQKQNNFTKCKVLLFSIFILCAMCNSRSTEAQENFVNDFIHDDTTGLIITDYKKWFTKYAEPNVALTAEHYAEVGCFYPEGIALLEEHKKENNYSVFRRN